MTPLDPATTRGEALRRLAAALEAAGIAEARLDARFLAAEAVGVTVGALLAEPGRPLGDAAARLDEFGRRRLAGEPVARILGAWEFWGLPFRLVAETLVPRPATETVVEAALARRPERGAPLTVLDLGTGTGCLLVALLHERPAARGLGVDRAEAALRTARANAQANGVGARAGFVAGHWGDPIAGRFDLVVSNPPYIPAGEIGGLAREVRAHDPRLALDGGADGLDAYRAILAQLPALLASSGLAVLEVGAGQAPAVSGLADAAGLRIEAVVADLAGHGRAVVLRP